MRMTHERPHAEKIMRENQNDFTVRFKRAPARYAIIVRQFFFEVFGKYWIGHESQHLPTPLEWLQRSVVKMRYGESWCRRLRYWSGDEFKTVSSAFASIAVVVTRRFSQRTWGGEYSFVSKIVVRVHFEVTGIQQRSRLRPQCTHVKLLKTD